MSQLAFQYCAIDRTGVKTKGVLRAVDQQEAYRKVVAAGLKPVRIGQMSRGATRWRGKKVRTKDLAHFTCQFAVLVEARIPLADGLRSIAEQEGNPRLRQILDEMAQKIESGCSVTDAITPHRDVFGDVYIETIRAAEATGNMVKVLAQLSEVLERGYETTKNVKSALMYPLCVVIALSAAVVFLTVFIVPKFTTMYASKGIDLPAPTKLLMGFSQMLRSYWYLVLGGMFGAILTMRHLWRKPASRQVIDGWLHKVPFLRDVLTGLAISRFAHVFGLCLQSGLGLIEALDMSGRASGRPLLQMDTEKMREQVNHGGRLSDVLLACNYMPGFARRMISAGEDAAELPKMCSVVARHYDREVSHLTKNVGTFIEPIMIVGLAVVVLFVALAIFLPMWNMTALLG